MGKKKKLILIIVLIFLIIITLLISIKNMQIKNFEKKMLDAKEDNSTKVYLLLLDAADPDIIDYLIDNGQLPNFKYLKENGAYSKLSSFYVTLYGGGEHKLITSLPIIATIFTGKSHQEHGMVSHVFNIDGPDYYYPFKNLKVLPIWQILKSYDKVTGIMGTQGNYPIEPINGFIISQEYVGKKILNNKIKYLKLFPDRKIIYPYFLKDKIESGLATQEELNEKYSFYNFSYDFPREVEQIFINRFNKTISLSNSSRIALKIARDLAISNKTAFYVFNSDYNIMQLSKQFYSRYNPNLFIEYLFGLDYFGTQYNIKEYVDYNNMNNELFNYYKLIDKHTGNIINQIGDNSVLIVISDHGIMDYDSLKNFKLSNLKSENGIFFIYGKNILKNITLSNVSVFDITPTILNIMDLPIGKDMSGKVIKGMINKNKVKYVDTYG